MSYDVTYCTARCGNLKCELHYSKSQEAVRWRGFASYADRSKGCSGYRAVKEEANNVQETETGLEIKSRPEL